MINIIRSCNKKVYLFKYYIKIIMASSINIQFPVRNICVFIVMNIFTLNVTLTSLSTAIQGNFTAQKCKCQVID